MNMTPQEKKRRSYARDRRNTYGENAKSSRKIIARNKRVRSRTERRVAREAFAGHAVGLDETRMDAAFARAALLRCSSWKKTPDEPLLVVVQRKMLRRARGTMARA